MSPWWNFWFRVRAKAAGLLGIQLRHSQSRYVDLLKSCIRQGCVWLDLGCGHQIFPDWAGATVQDQFEVAGRAALLVGIDGDRASLSAHPCIQNKVVGDIHRLPFAAASFDVVTANMVVEHVSTPEAALEEVARVLAPGGVFVLHTTNARFYQVKLAALVPARWRTALVAFIERRRPDDIYPTYYRLNTQEDIAALAGNHGFRVIRLDIADSVASTVQLGPIVLVELLITKLLGLGPLRKFRSNILSVLEKTGAQVTAADRGA